MSDNFYWGDSCEANEDIIEEEEERYFRSQQIDDEEDEDALPDYFDELSKEDQEQVLLWREREREKKRLEEEKMRKIMESWKLEMDQRPKTEEDLDDSDADEDSESDEDSDDYGADEYQNPPEQNEQNDSAAPNMLPDDFDDVPY